MDISKPKTTPPKPIEPESVPEEHEEKKAEHQGVPIVAFGHVSKIFSGGFVAIQDIDLHIMPGEFISLVGASGAGKSTLLKLITAEEEPSEGIVFFNGRDIGKINRKHLPYYRRNIGTVFQDFKLLPHKTAYENVSYALEVYGKPTEEIMEEVPEILDIVGLAEQSDKLPKQLSGGEQQRVAIARALILRPKVIIADEPTGNLDPVSADEILNLLTEINSIGTTVILATHNQQLVDKVGKRVIVLDRGRIVSDEHKGRYVLPEKQKTV